MINCWSAHLATALELLRVRGCSVACPSHFALTCLQFRCHLDYTGRLLLAAGRNFVQLAGIPPKGRTRVGLDWGTHIKKNGLPDCYNVNPCR